MTFDEINNKLKESMTFDGIVNKRYYHSLGVVEYALMLNERYHLGLDDNKIKIAAILHDCAKFYKTDELINIIKQNEPNFDSEYYKNVTPVLHGLAGKYVARDEYGINDKEILDAIYYHTVGKAKMSSLEEIIFVSDYCEKTRVGEFFDTARIAVLKDLHYGTYTILKQTFEYLKNSGKIIDGKLFEALEYYQQFERI